MVENHLKKVRIALKRESASYFESIKDTFVPLKGEVIIIDTEDKGIRTKIGNGVDTLTNLPYTDEDIRSLASGIVVKGYYHEDKFYSDIDHTIKIVGYGYKLYIDIPTRSIYAFFDETGKFEEISSSPKQASSEVSGIAKLYESLGDNVDGSINQKTITDEVNKKFTISLDHDEGLIFEDGIPDNEV